MRPQCVNEGTLNELTGHCLTAYKKPNRMDFVEVIPKTLCRDPSQFGSTGRTPARRTGTTRREGYPSNEFVAEDGSEL